MNNSEIPYPQSEIKKYRHIFFDLDHTIWDFDKNAEETLHELICPASTAKCYWRRTPPMCLLKPIPAITTSYGANIIWVTLANKPCVKLASNKPSLDLGVQPELIPHGFEDAYVKLCPYQN
jgi:putative hydrolase of the HAD superfamily